jgi:copper chaperone
VNDVVQAQRAVLDVPDVSCDHCRAAIEGALRRLQGVDEVEVDLGSKKVAVEYDRATIELSTIKEAIEQEGYPIAGEQVLDV